MMSTSQMPQKYSCFGQNVVKMKDYRENTYNGFAMKMKSFSVLLFLACLW